LAERIDPSQYVAIGCIGLYVFVRRPRTSHSILSLQNELFKRRITPSHYLGEGLGEGFITLQLAKEVKFWEKMGLVRLFIK